MNPVRLATECLDDLGRARDDGKLRRKSPERGDGVRDRDPIPLTQNAQRFVGLSVRWAALVHRVAANDRSSSHQRRAGRTRGPSLDAGRPTAL